MIFWDYIKSFFTEPKWSADMEECKNPDWLMLWNTCKVDPSKNKELHSVCDKINHNKARYKAVADATHIPWYVIACLHYREADLDFTTCLHNGDKLPGPTHHVPKGRGPFHSWEEAAIDALKYDEMDKKDYSSLGLTLKACEAYNGVGYHNKGIYSPYIWSGTNHYTCGKYAEDGIYDRSLKDQQLGVAAIIKSGYLDAV